MCVYINIYVCIYIYTLYTFFDTRFLPTAVEVLGCQVGLYENSRACHFETSWSCSANFLKLVIK